MSHGIADYSYVMNCRGAESLAVERWPIISRILWNLVVQYRLQRSLPLAAVVAQMNPSHMLKISGIAKLQMCT